MYKIGDVVIATAGKERGQLFVIVKVEDGYAYLSDGKRLKKDKPKKKSFKHIRRFGSDSLSESDVLDGNARVNAKIRNFLSSKKELSHVEG